MAMPLAISPNLDDRNAQSRYSHHSSTPESDFSSPPTPTPLLPSPPAVVPLGHHGSTQASNPSSFARRAASLKHTMSHQTPVFPLDTEHSAADVKRRVAPSTQAQKQSQKSGASVPTMMTTSGAHMASLDHQIDHDIDSSQQSSSHMVEEDVVRPQYIPSRNLSMTNRRASGHRNIASHKLDTHADGSTDLIYAADRSPLQDLEVRLAQKEKKRLRVQAAERRLLEKQKRTMHSQQSIEGSQSNDLAHFGSKSAAGDHRPPQPSQGASIKVSNPRISQTTRSGATHQRDRGKISQAVHDTSKTSGSRSPVLSESPPIGGRGSPRFPSTPQSALHSGRKTSHKVSTRPDPIAVDTVKTWTSKGPNYQIPPQTSAALEAKQKVGFGSTSQQIGDLSITNAQPYTGLLHYSKTMSTQIAKEIGHQGPTLKEWRSAGTARLSGADMNDDMLNEFPWWEKSKPSSRRRSQRRSAASEELYPEGAKPTATTFSPPLHLKCGPLLRYTGIRRTLDPDGNKREVWRGSVMIVTSDSQSYYEPAPMLRLFPEPMEKMPPPHQQEAESQHADDLPIHYMDPIAGLPKLSRTGQTIYVKPVDDLEHAKDLSKFEDKDEGLFEEVRSAAVPTAYGTPGFRYGQNGPSPRTSSQRYKSKRGQKVRGARLIAERGFTFWRFNIEVELQPEEIRVAYSINSGPSIGFWIPALGASMNIMFHSCNGFSLGVDPDDFSGPDPLWRDVLNKHQTQPFHVMLGGGDQIYNDVVMEKSPLLSEWLDMRNPHHKHSAEFTSDLKNDLEQVYFENYSAWFSQGLFGMANCQIPMVNIWDDHDIIDGFGSYPHHFMKAPVFCGLGAIAFKYYMLFQHQSVVDETAADEPSWLLGAAPGPYINELSRSIFISLGQNISFLGLDCRMERMRDEILSEATYELIFDRCRREIASGEIKHLIVLLGVPIAYPRLVWLENVLTSRALDPIKAMGRMGLFGNLLNKFDGGVEILDDLDDHWTARNHKTERNWFIQELQELSADNSVRITILGGDVHLGAVGQFISDPKLKIPKDRDHRYMPNVISSAIVNTPPPSMMCDVLNKRNKKHRLDPDTIEHMIPMFSHDVDGKDRNNKTLLPRRNWCSIREYCAGTTPPPTPPPSEPDSDQESEEPTKSKISRTMSLNLADHNPGNLLKRLSLRTKLVSAPEATTQIRAPQRDDSPRNRLPVAQSAAVISNDGCVESVPRSDSARPGILRRPTDLKVDKGQNADATHGHINIEHSLDIVLNFEKSQHDPAGHTAPYRFLVPALFYQGDGDENTARLKRLSMKERIGSIYNRHQRSKFSQSDGVSTKNVARDEELSDSEVPAQRSRLLDRFNSFREKKDHGEEVNEPADTTDVEHSVRRPSLLQRISSIRITRTQDHEGYHDDGYDDELTTDESRTEEHQDSGRSRRPSLLKRLSNRMPRDWDLHSSDGSFSQDEEASSEPENEFGAQANFFDSDDESVRPRRWSFRYGKSGRRGNRDATHPQSAMYPPPDNDDAMQATSGRDISQGPAPLTHPPPAHMMDGRYPYQDKITSPTSGPTGPTRQPTLSATANTYPAFKHRPSTSEDIRSTSDVPASDDYHAFIDTRAQQARPSGIPAQRRSSKAERMLGTVNDDTPQTRHRKDKWHDDDNDQYHRPVSASNERQITRQLHNDNNFNYPESRRASWRKSLRLFSV